MSVPAEHTFSQFGDRATETTDSNAFVVSVLTDMSVRIEPLELLKNPEPIPDAKGSLTSDQLREIAKRHQPPASWFEGDEEQLF